MNNRTDKATRLLCINDCLREGRLVSVDDLVRDFNISSRSVHRDINVLRDYYAN